MSHRTHNRTVFTKTIFETFLALCLFLGVSTAKGSWADDANNRIEQMRKRNAQITIVDMNNNPVQDINVQITQVTHSFAFGSCFNSSYLNNTTYTTFFKNHFEWAVCENESKWTANEPTQGNVTYTNADNIYTWCHNNGITMRGHNIFWEQSSSLPSWVTSLAYAPWPQTSALYTACQNRINSVVPHFQGKFVHWDVDNEQLSSSFFDELEVVSTDVNSRVWMYSRAHQLDPNCILFTNEYSGNSFGNFDGSAYVALINNLRSKGAPINAIGIQGHITSPFGDAQAQNYWTVLKTLGTLGLPIWATEFDSDTTSDSQRATDLDNFYRICYSDPNVNGIMMWGFMVGTTWRASGAWGLVSSSGTLNAAGTKYESLMNAWTTNDANYTDPNGKVNFRGFNGSYDITLSAPGQTAEIYEIDLDPGTTTALFTLPTDLHSPEPDFNAPTPNPMTWATVPTTAGSYAITMIATTATDATNPVRYYFECTNHGEANSTWQTSPTYLAQGLNPLTSYSFRVKARDSAAVPNETGWSSTLSATTAAPGTDVNIIGSWVSGTTHAKENGTNRALIFIAHGELTSAMNLGSVTYGGQAMTKVVDINYNAASGWAYTAAYILKETGVAAATSGTFVPTWSGTSPSAIGYSSAFFSNVDQTTPAGATGTGGSTTNPVTTGALSTNNKDMVILGATCGNSGSYMLNNNFIEGTDQTMSSTATGVTGHKPATGVAETPSATYSSTINRQCIIGFVIKAASIPPTYPDCAAVQAGGYGLDSDLNGDCYVNLLDLEIMADYWLHNDCTAPGNCQGADFAPTNGTVDFFDFADFGSQWMQCNNPQDANCVPNW